MTGRIDGLIRKDGAVAALVIAGGREVHRTRWYEKGEPTYRMEWAIRAAERWLNRETIGTAEAETP